jgi:hypothetical protein
MINVKQFGDRASVNASECGRCYCWCFCSCYLPPSPAAAYLGNYTTNAASSAYSFADFIDIYCP